MFRILINPEYLHKIPFKFLLKEKNYEKVNYWLYLSKKNYHDLTKNEIPRKFSEKRVHAKIIAQIFILSQLLPGFLKENSDEELHIFICFLKIRKTYV